MKIAQIVCTFPPYKGGIGSVAYNFARILSLEGNEVTVLTPGYQKSDKQSGLFKIERINPYVRNNFYFSFL